MWVGCAWWELWCGWGERGTNSCAYNRGERCRSGVCGWGERSTWLAGRYRDLTVTDVTEATFQTQVIERSKTVPVVVDLWAEWCQPCRQLGPILEKVVAETEGAVELAKVDIDKNPSIAQAFRVQSIPAVYAMVDGSVSDGFLGAQGEPAVREFVQRLVPEAAPTEVEKLIAAGDEASLRAALEISPDDETALVALAEVLINDGRADEADDLLEHIPESPEVRHMKAKIRLAKTSGGDLVGGAAGDVEAVEAELATLVTKVKVNEDARQRFVDLLEVLGPDDPRTEKWRKRLASALF